MNRSSMGLLGVVLTGVLLLGCSAFDPNEPIGCRDDSNCADDQVCFVDGCGDPGRNLVVEVIPNAKEGLFAQDLRVDELRDQQTLLLHGPSTLQARVRVVGATSSTPYSAPVTLRITGESLLIPGVPRWQEDSTLEPSPQGTYSAYTLSVASGRYTVKLLTTNSELPPLSSSGDVQPGSSATLDFSLPDASLLVQMTGKVLRYDNKLMPRDVPLSVQVLDEKKNPLTQRVSVDPDTGLFTLVLLRTDLEHGSLTLQVTSTNYLVPQMLVHLDPGRALTEPILLPDYGEPVRLQGRVVDSANKPVAGATLFVSGSVLGGGQYRSPQVESQGDGTFELLTLPSPPLGSGRELVLTILPRAGNFAGSTETSLVVPRVSVSKLGDVVCQERRKVVGTVLGPVGSLPAAGVQVEATLLKEVVGTPRPASSRVAADRRTDEAGHFELWLDPGVYRFDFASLENLPRFSRIVTVHPWTAATPPPPQEVSVTLPKGRRVTGYVRHSEGTQARPNVPNAALRFYRLVAVEGENSALLLGETTSDAAGAFYITLPLP
ncbi:carboxypeptidase regulatory-like domain-containing protein [Cystobacter fuscus]|uniref:carboxypeptidase regulatory-like domain-containing protein n=1 Tax=Cystobacter fuscus TaxID=43 RepID=UPI002B3072FA|nr:carboxypeptidase regulatory-like domain-containing protein [Cystobacter fuscus]